VEFREHGSVLILKHPRIIRAPLKVCTRNPRYFADENDHPIYLTGSHTWSNIQEFESDTPFDYEGYLTWLEKLGHNFTRLWTWEAGTNAEWMNGWSEEKIIVEPTIYERTGAGEAVDGKPKFDLSKFNEVFFDRLRQRADLAQSRGFYVSVMLFQGYELERRDRKINPWDGHPYNRKNNVNGIDGDPQHEDNGYKLQTLEILEITRLQEEYLRKILDTVNYLDNVLYEVSNESHRSSTKWHYHVIDFVHSYEKTKKKQHPIGMTCQNAYKLRGLNQDLFEGPADWVSPSIEAEFGYNYAYNPPPTDGRKVILTDTDHLWGIGGDSAWVWKSFLRGLNVLFMDPYDTGFMDPNDSGLIDRGKIDSDWDSARKAMGQTREFSERMDLANMVPHSELSHSHYCLAYPEHSYLVYYPTEMTKRVQVDLRDCDGWLSVEWFNPDTGNSIEGEKVKGGEKRVFISPFTNAAVLYLNKVD
jgi:hypothetical protein